MRKTKNFALVIRAKLKADPKLADAVRKELLHSNIAQAVFDLRIAAGLTQLELAKLAKTSQSVIARIEDSDYEKHSFTLLRRIAKAVGKEVRVAFIKEII